MRITGKHKAISDVGQMRHRVDIKSLVRVADDYGGNARQDVVLKRKYAHVRTVNVKELGRDDRLQGRIFIGVTMRYDSSVERGSTLVYKGEDYYIESINQGDHENRFMVMLCRTGGPL